MALYSCVVGGCNDKLEEEEADEKPSILQSTILHSSAHLERIRSLYHVTLFCGLVLVWGKEVGEGKGG